ncbi:MAG TPA: enoyl-CoA hydratase/isomerase family protein [Acidimicrobiales bacterium]|nr:enoyl-CoA hydratase/isomerase family protein [Acidimicrobiales bacterium]
MTYSPPPELLIDSDGPVRIVTLNNPEMRNAFIDPLHDAMCEVWAHLAEDPECLAVVLTGAGKAFSAGGNVPGFIRDYESPEHRRRSIRQARRLMDEMTQFHKPIVAAVNGPAVGLGCSVAVSCDIVLIADTAFIADTHVAVGLVAGDGGAVAWPLMMSLLKAKEYLLTCDRIPAPLAVELGLANRVVPADQVVAEALALAHRIAKQPPQAVQETKRALNLHLQAAINRVAPFALSAEAESFATDDVKRFVEQFKQS